MQRLTSRPDRADRAPPRFAGRHPLLGFGSVLVVTATAACQPPVPAPAATVKVDALSPSASIVIESPAGTPRPPFQFSAEDDQFLDEVEHSAFLFLWTECSPKTGMVVDRTSVTFASIAGVGFQLAALPIGVERGWVTRDDAAARAVKILDSLAANPNCRKEGLFYHFLDADRAEPTGQDAVSTIDSAIFFAGALVAGSYFGGEIREKADRLFAEANWAFFIEQSPRAHEPHMKGFLSLGWKPSDPAKPAGAGKLLPYYWADSGDEHRLVTFLAVAATNPDFRAEPTLYYRLRRPLGEYPGVERHVYLPWSGALFTDVFANCFINYAAMGPDNPATFGVEHRPRVDWWENSRRAVQLHRVKATEAQESHAAPNLGANAWGLTACDGPEGYMVPGIYPTPSVPPDYRPDLDYAKFTPKDDLGHGIVAPYGAGCAVMFQPSEAIAALRHYRALVAEDGRPQAWRQPAAGVREYGFRDSFDASNGWVAPDYVSIDQGPLVLAIENARSGRIWRWFQACPAIHLAGERLGWRARDR